MSDNSEELFWESRVAESLGVARKIVAKLRAKKLTPVEHYRKEKNNVVLTPAGLARLKELLAKQASGATLPTDPATATETTPKGPPPRQKMIVVKAPLNPRLLWCRAADDKKSRQVLVRVTANTNFMPGMEFEAVACGENFWQYTGRLPRRKGRW